MGKHGLFDTRSQLKISDDLLKNLLRQQTLISLNHLWKHNFLHFLIFSAFDSLPFSQFTLFSTGGGGQNPFNHIIGLIAHKPT